MAESFYKAGQKYFIRTVSSFFTGRLVTFNDKELLFSEAAWIPDAGRLSEVLKTGKFAEAEPYLKDVIINRDCIVDGTVFNHELPTHTK
jgi:hypothetical protein